MWAILGCLVAALGCVCAHMGMLMTVWFCFQAWSSSRFCYRKLPPSPFFCRPPPKSFPSLSLSLPPLPRPSFLVTALEGSMPLAIQPQSGIPGWLCGEEGVCVPASWVVSPHCGQMVPCPRTNWFSEQHGLPALCLILTSSTRPPTAAELPAGVDSSLGHSIAEERDCL